MISFRRPKTRAVTGGELTMRTSKAETDAMAAEFEARLAAHRGLQILTEPPTLFAPLITVSTEHGELNAERIREALAELANEQVRGEAALLREEIAALRDVVCEGEEVIAELQGALDTTRPAPDPVWLGAQIERAWFRASATFIPTTQAWTQVAETAIDAVRGLWPTPTPDADREAGPGSDGKSPTGSAGERAPVGGDYTITNETTDEWRARVHRDGRFYREPPCECGDDMRPGLQHVQFGVGARCFELAPQTSPGGGEEAGVTSTPTGDPAPGDTQADDHREQLAITIARRDLAISGADWDGWTDRLRDYYRAGADDVIERGWRPPPTAPSPTDRVPVIAQVLTDHELLADDTCRCGAGVLDAGFGLRDWPLWHAEHVATQLLVTGVLA